MKVTLVLGAVLLLIHVTSARHSFSHSKKLKDADFKRRLLNTIEVLKAAQKQNEIDELAKEIEDFANRGLSKRGYKRKMKSPADDIPGEDHEAQIYNYKKVDPNSKLMDILESMVDEHDGKVAKPDLEPWRKDNDKAESMDAHRYTKQQQIEMGLISENPDEPMEQRNFIKNSLWEKGIVPYEIRTADFTTGQITTIQNAIKEMNDKTCLRIEPRSTDLATEAGHNSYVQVISDSGCYSYVGRVFSTNQALSLQAPGCVTNSITIHEFGHAIGMMHEQSRADRDNYVRINWNNLSGGTSNNNMFKEDTQDNNPYDLESVLQYGLYSFSINGQKTIDVLDPRLEFLADTAEGLEFYDAQDIIDAYGCAANCGNIVCQHLGYVDHQCKCVCPRGVTGTNCETLITENTCGGDIVLNPGDSQVITSPNYPNNYNQNEQCVWYIKAIQDQYVRLDIDELDLADSGSLCYHWLEVQYNLIGQTGPRRCGSFSNVNYITSTDQKSDMMLIFDTKYNSQTATRKGFSLRVSSAGPGCSVNPCKFGTCSSTDSQGGYQCTCDAGYTGSNCDTLINDVTLTCGFESNEGACFMEDSTNDQFDWATNTGGTPSTGTGPTGAATGSNYLYAETSSPRVPGDIARLQTSAKFPATVKCLEFRYNMNGPTMGTLRVKYSGDNVAETILWTQSGDQADVWFKKSVDIPATQGVQVFIEAVVGSSWQSDIAIDDLKISGGACVVDPCDNLPCQNGGTCTSSGSSYTCSCFTGYQGTNCENAEIGATLTCTVEDNQACFLKQNKDSDNHDWTRNSGQTPSVGTGPSSAFEGSYYYYFETSSPVVSGATAILVSNVNFQDSQYCLRFNYHMYGTTMGSLRVEKISATNSVSVLFSQNQNLGDTWNSAELDVNLSGTGNKIQFVGVKGTDFESDIAIDNIIISPGLCDPSGNPCDSNPCLNGATCSSSGSTFTCQCASGFTGNTCDKQIMPCNSNPCNNGGTCIDLSSTTFSCQCASGFTGSTCDVQILPCDANPCQNGGTCNNVGTTSYTCNCPNLFTGTNCETQLTPCMSGPCNNGGTCIDLSSTTFSCQCASGFTGSTCDVQILPCDANPCQNGGTCNNVGTTSYTCNCPNLFTGTNCETQLTPCMSRPCNNGGTCIDLSSTTFSCRCASGFTGPTCDAQILPCDANPCQNGGTCNNVGTTSYTCNCPNLFTGPNCETQLLPCTSAPCNNGGTCTDLTSTTFSCQCASGFTGLTCDAQFLPCDTNPCQNGATCANIGTTSFSCICAEFFTGSQCETEMRPCTSGPCNNGGTCTDLTSTTFSCQCSTGFTGPTCDTQVVLPCESNPCSNGGTCIKTNSNSFTCQCPPGFTGNTCDDTIVISEWTCGFENGFGGNCFLVQEDIFDTMDWTIRQGRTPTGRTGPNAAYEGVKYAYLEASSPAQYGDWAVMKSTENFSDTSSYCLSFRYYMYGNNRRMGWLVVYNTASDNDVIYIQTGNQGQQWIEQRLTIPPTPNMQVRIEAIRGSSHRTDIAVDDVKLIEGPCA